jgi:predicted DNA-binding ribbon-helix-helix protein
MKTVAKHSIFLNDRETSISLENEFWQGLREIAEQEGASTGELVAKIDRERNNRNLSSAIRIFVYSHFRAKHP